MIKQMKIIEYLKSIFQKRKKVVVKPIFIRKKNTYPYDTVGWPDFKKSKKSK